MPFKVQDTHLVVLDTLAHHLTEVELASWVLGLQPSPLNITVSMVTAGLSPHKVPLWDAYTILFLMREHTTQASSPQRQARFLVSPTTTRASCTGQTFLARGIAWPLTRARRRKQVFARNHGAQPQIRGSPRLGNPPSS